MTLAVLVALTAIYVVTGVLYNSVDAFQPIYRWFVVDWQRVLSGQVWQLATYALLHDIENPFHLLFNGFVFYMFGPDLERLFGRRNFIAFIATSVVVGGLFIVASGALGLGVGRAVGFSAVTEAAVVAWALRNRTRTVYMWFAIPTRGIWMLAFALLMVVLDARPGSDTSAAGHLGGILVGMLVGFDVPGRIARLRQPKLTVVPRASVDRDRWVN